MLRRFLWGVSFVLALVTLVGPWWTISIEASSGEQTFEQTADFGLLGADFTVEGLPGGPQRNSTDYATMPVIGFVFRLGAVFVLVGISSQAAFVLSAQVSGWPFRFRVARVVFGFLAPAMLAAAPIAVMAALPGAQNTDPAGFASVFGFDIDGFWGLAFRPSTTLWPFPTWFRWAAGWAWYLAVLAAVVSFLAGFVAFWEEWRAIRKATWTRR